MNPASRLRADTDQSKFDIFFWLLVIGFFLFHAFTLKAYPRVLDGTDEAA